MVRVSDFSYFSSYCLCFTSRMIPEGAGLIADIHTWARGSYGTRCESINITALAYRLFVKVTDAPPLLV